MSYDLSATVFPYLTPHLIASLLKHLQDQKVYPEDFLVKQRHTVLAKTSNFGALVALAEEYPQIITADKKAQYATAKATADEQFQATFQALGSALGPYVNKVAEMQTRDLQNLSKTAIEDAVYALNAQLPALLAYAAAAVDNGHYLKGATAYLVYFLAIEGQSVQKPLVWSMVEASLLCRQHHVAILEVFMKKLRELIDNSSGSMTLAQQSRQRATFLSYALYAFTTEPQANAILVQRNLWSDMIYSQNIAATSPAVSHFAQERLLNALLFDAPSLFRYVVLSTLIAANIPVSQMTPWLLKKNSFVRELTRVTQIQFPTTAAKDQKDPIIRFFQYALIEFDLQAALEVLHKDIPQVFATDIFLGSKILQLEFYEAAKAILIDTTLRLNTKITPAGLQTMLPFNIQFEGFNNAIGLVSKESKAAAAAAKDAAATTPEGTASDATAATTEGQEAEIEVAVPVNPAQELISPLLNPTNFHSRIVKKANAPHQAQSSAAAAATAKTR